MAIKKDKLTEQGITADYHKIIDMTLDFRHKHARAILGVYLSKEARDNGSQPITIRELVIEKDNFDSFSEQKDVRKAAYEYIMELDEFSGGTVI